MFLPPIAKAKSIHARGVTTTAQRPERAKPRQELSRPEAARDSHSTSWSFGKVSVFPSGQTRASAGSAVAPARHATGPIQTKLKVGSSRDPLEKEADVVADRVLQQSSFRGQSKETPRISPANGVSHERVSRQGTQAGPATADTVAPNLVHDVVNMAGKPLDAGTREYFEPRIGHDLSNVRVHADGSAAQSAQSIHAHAYTAGHSIVFGDGKYAPETHDGKRLLAHELTHVVQQAGGTERVQRQPVEKEDDEEHPKTHGVSVPKPYDSTATLYKDMCGPDGCVTEKELDRRMEALQDPSVRAMHNWEKLSAEFKKEADRQWNADRHERLVKYGILLKKTGVSADNAREHLFDHLSMSDLQVLKHFGLDLNLHWYNRKNFLPRMHEAIDKYDDAWQRQHADKPKERDEENQMLDAYLRDIEAIDAHQRAAYDPEVLEGIEGGIFGAVGYGVFGDEGAKLGASFDQMLGAAGGTLEARSGMPSSHSVYQEDIAAEVRPAEAKGPEPTPGETRQAPKAADPVSAPAPPAPAAPKPVEAVHPAEIPLPVAKNTGKDLHDEPSQAAAPAPMRRPAAKKAMQPKVPEPIKSGSKPAPTKPQRAKKIASAKTPDHDVPATPGNDAPAAKKAKATKKVASGPRPPAVPKPKAATAKKAASGPRTPAVQKPKAAAVKKAGKVTAAKAQAKDADSAKKPVPSVGSKPSRATVKSLNAGQVTRENLEKVKGMSAFLKRFEKVGRPWNEWGFKNVDDLVDFVNKDPKGAVEELNHRADVKQSRGDKMGSPQNRKPDTAHSVQGPEKKWSRSELLGNTPGKDSPTGRAVQARMRKDKLLRGAPGKEVFFDSRTKKWYPVNSEDTNMGHTHDAVVWWNQKGMFYARKSPEVRAWMENPDNYALEYGPANKAAGGALPDRYVAQHPDPIDTTHWPNRPGPND